MLFSADLHLLHALFRAMVASSNRHRCSLNPQPPTPNLPPSHSNRRSVTLSLVRVIEHAGQMEAVVRAAAASEVQSCSDAALLFRRRSLAFNLMKTLLQLLSERVMSAVLISVLPVLDQLLSSLPSPPPCLRLDQQHAALLHEKHHPAAAAAAAAAVDAVITSLIAFTSADSPPALRVLLAAVRAEVEKKFAVQRPPNSPGNKTDFVL